MLERGGKLCLKYKAALAGMRSWQRSHNMPRRPADTASSCPMPSLFLPYQLRTSHSSDWKSVAWDTGRALHSNLTTRGRAFLTTLCNSLLPDLWPIYPPFISLHSNTLSLHLFPFPSLSFFLLCFISSSSSCYNLASHYLFDDYISPPCQY